MDCHRKQPACLCAAYLDKVSPEAGFGLRDRLLQRRGHICEIKIYRNYTIRMCELYSRSDPKRYAVGEQVGRSPLNLFAGA